jgi:hypothetical protein
MKQYLMITTLMVAYTISYAQVKKENIGFTYAEFKGGYGVSSFGKGLAEKYRAGNFSSSGGGLATLAAYKKFKNLNFINLGIKYKSLGAAPAQGDNGDEMFFNFWGAAIATKFFPMDKNGKKGIYLQGDYFFVTQFTQKYRNTLKSIYDHQFAIGSSFCIGVGYDLPLGQARNMLTFGLEYDAATRRGEVTGIGNKQFKSSNFGLMLGLKF